MKPKMVEVFAEGMTVKEALDVAVKHMDVNTVAQFMRAFEYFRQHDGSGMSMEDAREAWHNLHIGVGAGRMIAIPVGLGEDTEP